MAGILTVVISVFSLDFCLLEEKFASSDHELTFNISLNLFRYSGDG